MSVFIALLIILSGLFDRAVSAQTPSSLPGTIRGVIVDARDGTPLEKVSVRVQDTKQTTVTGPDGRFEIESVPPGPHELYISSVDYILVRRSVEVPSGEAIEITIPISAGTGTYTETVDVSATSAAPPGQEATSIQVLRSNELQQLRGLITNDPFRAIQVLPGVTSGDDLRSEFSARGLGVANMNFSFEGVATPLLVHTVQGVQDSGSIAMVNGDILDEISLSMGSYPERYGNRTGAELNFLVREGSREGVRGHVGVSVTDSSAVLEGPIGSIKKGSWLVSYRKSYLDAVIRKIDPTNDFGFGFSDVQSKIVYDPTAKHQLQFAVTVGRSRLTRQSDEFDPDDVGEGTNETGVAIVTWRYLASPRFVLTQKLAVDGNRFQNINSAGNELTHGRLTDAMYRVDWNFSPSKGVAFEGGGEARRSTGSWLDFDRTASTSFVRENYSAHTIALSSYVMARASKWGTVFAPGLRTDYFSLTGHGSASPWIDVRRPLVNGVALRAGAGIYRQEPSFAELTGLRSGDLDAARAFHSDVGVEGRVTRSTRWQFTAYNREDRDYSRLPDSEFRLINNRLVVPSFMTRYGSTIDGHSRGVEVSIQRRTPNGLSGWIGYDLSFTKFRDRATGEQFWGDYDQRHTLNAYGLYRFSDRMSFSARFRGGSNFPVPGYYESRDGRQFLSSTRNDLRVPVYTRLDVRANRTFTWNTTRLTLFIEALNLLDRPNVRAASPGINGRTFEVFGLYDSMFPRVPSAGFLLEF